MTRDDDIDPEVTAKATKRIIDNHGNKMDDDTRSRLEIKQLSAKGRLAAEKPHRHQSR